MSSKASLGVAMINPKMLKIVSYHVKTKRMHNKRICNKETQKMCDKAADDYAHALKFVPE